MPKSLIEDSLLWTYCGRWRTGLFETTYKGLPCSQRTWAARLEIRAIDRPTAGAAEAAGPESIALKRFELLASLQITKRCFPSKRLVKKPFGCELEKSAEIEIERPVVDSKDGSTLRYRAMFNPPWVQPLDQLSLSLGRYNSNGLNSCVDFKLCT